MLAWPDLVFGVLFIVAAAWWLIIGPLNYKLERSLPKWMLPLPRIWPGRYDVVMVRLGAAFLAGFGILLIAESILRSR